MQNKFRQCQVPNYVDTTHFTFVCTKCSGLHRELQFKVKGISLSNFTEEEVASVAKMGNIKFNEEYLAKFADQSLPNANDAIKFKEYIKQKYIDKRWHQSSNSSVTSTNVNNPNVASKVNNHTTVNKEKNPNAIKPVSNSTAPVIDLFNQSAFSNSNSATAFDPFGSQPSSASFTSFTSTPANQSSFNVFDATPASTSSNFLPPQHNFGLLPSPVTFDPFQQQTSGAVPASTFVSQTTSNFNDFTSFASPTASAAIVKPQPSRNMSAFDDLLTTSISTTTISQPVPQQAPQQAVNPFDSFGAVPVAASQFPYPPTTSQQQQFGFPQQPLLGQPVNQQPNINASGQTSIVSPYQQPYPSQYPPSQYQHQPLPVSSQQGAYSTPYLQQHQQVFPNQHSNNVPMNVSVTPVAAPVPTVNNDPFSGMTDFAYTAVNKPLPQTQQPTLPTVGYASSSNATTSYSSYPQTTFGAPIVNIAQPQHSVDHYTVAAAPNPFTQSVSSVTPTTANPFDLFG